MKDASHSPASAPQVPGSPCRHDGPPVTVTFEAPRPSPYPRAARVLQRSGKALRYLALVAGALWVFGGMAWFFYAFSSCFYTANEQAIGSVFDRLFH